MTERTVGSILAVDFGSVHTRAVLVELVEGVYRLVARAETRSTDVFPVHDMAVGFDRVLRQISDVTGRRFLSEEGTVIKPEGEDRSGVDNFALTASMGRPLRAVLVGLMPGMSLGSAIRAAAGTYIEVAETLDLGDGRDEEERINALLLSYPDVILLTGGTEDGAENTVLRLAETVRLALTLVEKTARPTVIFSGNHALEEPITEMFGEMTTLLFAENVRPSVDDEELDSARLQLGKAFDHYKETRDEGFAFISALSDTGILPTAQSYTVLAGYLGQTTPGDVALVDIGSSTSTLAVSQGNEGEVINSIRTDLGMGHSASQALEIIGMEKIRRWIPFNVSESELKNYAVNKTLRPATIPMDLRDLYIEHAFLRAGIREMMREANPRWDRESLPISELIGSGASLTNTGDPGYDALLLLDALQPTGVTHLQTDPYGLVAAMGAMAVNAPDAVVHLLDENNLNSLGTCISLDGKPRKDKPAMKVKITAYYGDEKDVLEETVLGGHLFVYPLPLGRTAEVRVRCMGRARINGKRRMKLTLNGGLAGLIFDARGRPVPVADDVRERALQFPMWVQEMTDDPLLVIDESWLQAVEEEDAAPKEEKRRRGRRRKKDDKAVEAVELDMEGLEDLEDLDESDLIEDDDLEAGLDDLLADLGDLDDFDDLDEDDELNELRDVLS